MIFSRILEKFDKNLIKYFLTHNQNFTDSSRFLVFFTDTVWILGPHGQAIRLSENMSTNMAKKHKNKDYHLFISSSNQMLN